MHNGPCRDSPLIPSRAVLSPVDFSNKNDRKEYLSARSWQRRRTHDHYFSAVIFRLGTAIHEPIRSKQSLRMLSGAICTEEALQSLPRTSAQSKAKLRHNPVSNAR